tara:strand:- start:1833 stop:1973 length:141 start_codon:yes stop_codon:yes gene_type:complete
MSLLKFIEKEPKFIMMEEMYERLEREPERHYKKLREDNARQRKGSA